MFRVSGPLKLINICRNAVTAVSPKTNTSNVPVLGSSEEGFRLATLARPLSPSYTRIVLVFNAGSRYESGGKDRGITHLLRRACGTSTSDFTAVNITRHFQQMGAYVTCMSTREHMLYAVDVVPSLASRAGQLLCEMATNSSFYEWELKSIVNPLMKKDIDLLQRRNLGPLCMELLHEAAFGLCPSGTGLGYSLFAPADRVGSYSLDQIERFLSHYFTPSNCSLAIVGPSSAEESMVLLREIKNYLRVHPQRAILEKTGKPHGFVGGDIRRDFSAATEVHACLAWPTAEIGASHQLAYDAAARLLTGAIGRISWGGISTKSIINSTATDLDGVQAVAFHKTYNGHGLFGVRFVGPSAQSIEWRLNKLIPALRSLTVSPDQLAFTKSILKADILMDADSVADLAVDLAVQISRPEHTYQSPIDRALTVDNLTAKSLTDAIQTLVSSPRAAFCVLGPEVGNISPLSYILN